MQLNYLEKLESSSEVWVPLSDEKKSERYKFDSRKFNEIKMRLKTFKPENENEIDLFLERLVFEVRHPDIGDIKILIKERIRSLIPIPLKDEQVEDARTFFQDKLKDFLEKKTGNWPGVQLRQNFLLEILGHLKETIELGSTTNYEGTTLQAVLEKNLSIDFCPDIQKKFKESVQNNSVKVIFITVEPEKSFPILASCKVLSYYRKFAQEELGKVWMLYIKSKDDGMLFANIFKHPNVEISRNTMFVVEFSQKMCNNGTSSEIVDTIFDQIQNNQHPSFIFITSKRTNHKGNKVSFLEITDDISCECFTKEAHKCLKEKLLPLRNGPEMSLEQLGIDLANLDSLSLSELVLANESCQLDLLLPFPDKEMEETYVSRKLKLPVIDTTELDEDLKDRLCFDGKDYDDKIKKNKNNSIHLLRSLKTLEIHHENSADLCLLSQSNVAGIDKLREYINLNSVKVDEKWLIRDDIFFAKSQVKAAIVVDLPGMGKSSLLTHLCNAILHDFINAKEGGSMRKLVLRINLGNCRPETWTMLLENETDAIEFLFLCSQSIMCQGATDSKRTMIHLSKSVFKEILSGTPSWSIIILLDGFDEIRNDGREFVEKKLIHLLMPMEGVDRIIVASRPDGHVHQKLEICFNQFALHLVEFDSEDQEGLLVALWRKLIRNEQNRGPSIDQSLVSERCEAFAKELVSTARDHLKDEHRTILDVPLQCILFAECFYDDLKNSFQDASFLPYFNEDNLDVLALFENFLNKKCYISYYEKRMTIEPKNDRDLQMYDDITKSAIESAMRLSIYNMTRDIEIAENLLGERWDRNRFGDEIDRVKKFGLVAYFDEDALNDGKITCFGLIHRTFAEYLVAKYLINAFKEPNNALLNSDRSDSYKILLDILLYEDEYEGIRRFFFRMVRDLLPDLTVNGCPFGTEDRNTVVKKWAALSHERFNDALASELIDQRMFYDYEVLDSLFFPSLTWLTLCLKEHVARNLTKDFTNSIIEAFFEQTSLEFQSDVEEHYLSDDSSVVCFMRKLRSILLIWYIHFAQAEETKANLNKYLFESTLALIEPLDDEFFFHYIQHLAAVCFAVGQRGFGLETNQLCNILQRIFDKDNESCLASFAVLTFNVWSELIDPYIMKYYSDKLWRRFNLFARFKEGDLEEFESDPIVGFEKVMKIGSPEFQDGDTSLLKIQIDWFLSLDFRVKNILLGDLIWLQSHQVDFINPFLVICVDYLLCMIDSYIKDETEANDLRRRVVRKALQMDARILRWLENLRILTRPGGSVDNENIAIKKAIETLPQVDQAAHHGEISFVTHMLQQNSLCNELFEWRPNLQWSFDELLSPSLPEDRNDSESSSSENSSGSEVQTFSAEQDRNFTIESAPPALFLAAANNQVEFIREVLDRLIQNGNEDQFKTFVSTCIGYSLVIFNDESLVLPFVDKAMTMFTKEEFSEIFPFAEKYAFKLKKDDHWNGGDDGESQILYILTINGWSGFLIKFIEFSVNDAATDGAKRVKITRRCLEIIHFLISDYVNIAPCGNALLVHALKIAEEAGIIHQEFYTSIGHSICRCLIHILSNYYSLEKASVEELESCLRTILSNLRRNLKEPEFIKFICGSEKYASGKQGARLIDWVGCTNEVLCHDIVQEFILQNLSSEGIEALVDVCTAVDKKGMNWMAYSFLDKAEHPEKDAIFIKVTEHLLTSDSGTKRFEKIALNFICEQNKSFLIVHLFDRKMITKKASFLHSAMGEKWAKILKIYVEDVSNIDDSLSNNKFQMRTFLTKCFESFFCFRKRNLQLSDSSEAVSLINLENYFDEHYPNSWAGESLSGFWMDIAINVLIYLCNEVQIMLAFPERENVLSTFFRVDKLYSQHDRFRLMAALSFIKELINTTFDVNNDHDLNQFIENLLNKRKQLGTGNHDNYQHNTNLFVSFDCLCLTKEFEWHSYQSFPVFLVVHDNESSNNSTNMKKEYTVNIIEKLVVERKFSEAFEYFLTCMRKEIINKHSSIRFFDGPNKICNGLIKFLVNVAIENRWII